MEIKLEKPYLTRLQFIDCAKFMVSSFSNLNDGFVEGSCEIKCKHGNDKKNVKQLEWNTNIVSVFLIRKR